MYLRAILHDYVHKYSMNKKLKAIQLRLGGRSYGEIQKSLDISSKGTLSYWFKNLILPLRARKRLKAKILDAKKRGLFKFNKERTLSIIKENQRILAESQGKIPKFSQTNLLILGTALYWGEGTTRVKQRGYQVVSFSNSDPEMIKIFMIYLRKILGIPENKIKPGIHIYPNLNPEKVKKFWSSITKLPKEKFYIFQNVSRASKFIRPKNFLPYGTLNIRVNDRRLFNKIKGYIAGISAQSLIYNKSISAQ